MKNKKKKGMFLSVLGTRKGNSHYNYRAGQCNNREKNFSIHTSTNSLDSPCTIAPSLGVRYPSPATRILLIMPPSFLELKSSPCHSNNSI